MKYSFCHSSDHIFAISTIKNMKTNNFVISTVILTLLAIPYSFVNSSPDAKRLYDDLLSNYNRLIRPVGNNSDRLTVKMGLKLSQLIEVNLRNQIMTTNVWVEQEWNDYKLKWNPEDYGGVDTLYVPSEHIWLPDIVLYNNADGSYEVTIMTKAILHYTGKVQWKPPAIYKSFCEIDVEYFPFDEQTCSMKFGSWTYDGYMMDLRHISQAPDSDEIEMGIDLQDYYLSVEWDIMGVPAVRHEKYYSCCEEPYLDIYFNITLRRKTLFYTVNLIIPCVGISFLSVLVFYLPSESGEKVSLCISILLSLTVFFLLLVEIIPPTSLTVPLLGKYLLFTMVLVTLSVFVTVAVLNVNFRSPVTHKMKPWVVKMFIVILPKVLFISRPKKEDSIDEDDNDKPNGILSSVFDVPSEIDKYLGYDRDYSFDYGVPPPLPVSRYSSGVANDTTGSNDTVVNMASDDEDEEDGGVEEEDDDAIEIDADEEYDDMFSPTTTTEDRLTSLTFESHHHHHHPRCPVDHRSRQDSAMQTIQDAKFIAQHVRNQDKFDEIIEDWQYVAMVLDRLFLWIFTLACLLGTALIVFQAPMLYDKTKPIDVIYSKIAKRKLQNIL
ncbi:acetylcholine receptor subunit alpha-like 1 isoform X1 [Daktulosphaira vitifoliae]|uniref:acetylcholine receptor subunit alpha-like 1 isoform X1 n=5 Tax=Daktulosphaira vitifoliae TaxID=58002 RepID=UPI0021AA5F13|nr:acetylcholine receptor subunit alpha-like 1 isoform X1 [Daktulosphaira vitifoliae]